jgi:hypothetical protein
MNNVCVTRAELNSTATKMDLTVRSAGPYIVSVRPTSFACRQQGRRQGHLLDVHNKPPRY